MLETGCSCNYAKMITVGLHVLRTAVTEQHSDVRAVRTVPITPLYHDCNRIMEEGSF